MARRFYILLMLALSGWFSWGGSFDVKQAAWAQSPGDSSRSDSDRRDRFRGRGFSDRGRGDWRSSRSRGDGERRSEERSGSSSTPSTNTSSSGSSAGSSSSTSSPTSSSTPSTSTNSSAASGIDLRSWATRLVKEHDKNSDMILQPEEQGFLGSSAAAQDLDHDGKITIDELVMYRSGGSSATSSPAPAAGTSSTPATDSGQGSDRDRDRSRFGYGRRDGESSGDNRPKSDSDPMSKRVFTGTAGGIGSTTKEGDKRHSYRFTRGSDKLPTGLPSWFKSRDTNGDGQVSMSEYSRSWSSSTAAEFRRLDRNDDGVVTAKEAK
jgi:EF hand domain-containing protein